MASDLQAIAVNAAVERLRMALATAAAAEDVERQAQGTYTEAQRVKQAATEALEAARKAVEDADWALREALGKRAGGLGVGVVVSPHSPLRPCREVHPDWPVEHGGVTLGTSAGDPFLEAGVEPTEGPLAEHRRREREGG